ncbi:MAG TPA: ATP-binding protein [Acidimicrobiales bacterium]
MAARPVRHAIATEADIVAARRSGRRLAKSAGFATADLTTIATAISEVARNITSYAGQGEMTITVIEHGDRRGIEVTAEDRGPGIADIDQALADGYSTGSGLGLGLPGARRLMDELTVDSIVGVGTTVVMRKWVADAVD